MFASGCSSSLVAPADEFTKPDAGFVILYDRSGNEIFRTAGSVSMPLAMVVNSENDGDNYRSGLRAARDQIGSLPSATAQQQQRKALKMQMLDALASRTSSAFVSRASRLPVEVVRSESAGSSQGMRSVQTDFIVNGRLVIRAIRQTSSQSASSSNNAQSARMNSTVLFEDELPCYENCGGSWPNEQDPPLSAAQADAMLAVIATAVADVDQEQTAFTLESELYARWEAGPPPSPLIQSGFSSLLSVGAQIGPCDVAVPAAIAAVGNFGSRAIAAIVMIAPASSGGAAAGVSTLAATGAALGVTAGAVGVAVAAAGIYYCHGEDLRSLWNHTFGQYRNGGAGGGSSW